MCSEFAAAERQLPLCKIGIFISLYVIFYEDFIILHQGRTNLQPRHQTPAVCFTFIIGSQISGSE